MAMELANLEFTEEQIQNNWLGTKPVSETEIKRTEKRLGVAFPKDLYHFLSITNGFSSPNVTEPNFEPIVQNL